MPVDITYNSIFVYSSLKPALAINVKAQFNRRQGDSADKMDVEFLMSELRLRNGIVICHAVPELQYTTVAQFPMMYNFLVYLDYDTLFKMEQARKNGDMNIDLYVRYVDINTPISIATVSNPPVQINIAKSDWTEKLMRDFKLKDIMLIELPRLSGDAAVDKVAKHLEDAHALLISGDYPNVMVACQKALEVMKGEYADKYNLKKAGGTDIDFVKFIDGDTPSQAADKTMQQLWLFLQSGGRHSGRSINKEDAEFALLTTYGMVNLIVRSTLPS
jgi:hypothetical protein